MSSDSYSVDVVIVGSGFAGSLTAAILNKHGFRVALLDRARHPRFAIGESSTPTANFILRDLALRHGLPELLPLCRFGSWRRAYPQVMNGLKRGFSYFQHEAGQVFQPAVAHANELLVAASVNDDVADTQWFRADVDEFLFRMAQALGTRTFEDSNVTAIQRHESGWLIETDRAEFRCRFLIDGTGLRNGSEMTPLAPMGRGAGGEGQLQSERVPRSPSPPTPLPKRGEGSLLANGPRDLLTNSRTLFGHFRDLPRWEEILLAGSPTATRDYPFRCDDAALHHVLEEGWMWWIRFANDITSVGLVLDGRRCPLDESQSPAAEWQQVVARYPSLSPLLNLSRLVAPSTGIVRTGRLQRRAAQCVGDGWALLPHTAGFIDPLHSTGIAYSLAGVDRLTAALIAARDEPAGLLPALAHYERSMLAELELVDLFVSGAYNAIAARSFRKFVAFSMSYFAAATTWERRRIAQPTGPTPMLFLADDPQFSRVVTELRAELLSCSDSDFERLCAERLATFDHVGLFTPRVPNMHGGTAVPE